MWNREANLLPLCKTYCFFLPIENKKLTKDCNLIGNDLETSEILLSVLFCIKSKERFSICKCTKNIRFLIGAFSRFSLGV